MKSKSFLFRLALLPFSCLLVNADFSVAGAVKHVIHVSVDGLRGDVVPFLGPTNLPNFYRLRAEGAYTDNARTDYDYSITLPNHTSQITGRRVAGTTGHNWTSNVDPQPGVTLESNRGFYIAGAFDVAHDHGVRTGEFASKTKFSLYSTSWDAVNGALDVTGEDNGRDKIDFYVNQADTAVLVNSLVSNMSTNSFGYVFLHFKDPDDTGHAYGWILTNGSRYCDSIKLVDSRLGRIFDMIDTNAALKGVTAIVLTSDHGGLPDRSHGGASAPENYTIPFYVWGPGVMPGADLYALNTGSRANPGTGRPSYAAQPQPIRNGDAANLCMGLLGLPPVPGSTINSNQDLALTVPPANLALTQEGGRLLARFIVNSGAKHDLEMSEDPSGGNWSILSSNLVDAAGSVVEIDLGSVSESARFFRLRAHF